MNRNYYGYEENGIIIALIDRTYKDEIDVILQDGNARPYKQRFWLDLTDKEAVDRCKLMKDKNIESD